MNFQVFTQQDFQCDKCQKEFYGATFYSQEGDEVTYCLTCYKNLERGATKVPEWKVEIELTQAIKELQTKKSEILSQKKVKPVSLDNLYQSLKEAERFAYDYWENEKKDLEKKVIQQVKKGRSSDLLLNLEMTWKESEWSYYWINGALKSFQKIVDKYEKNNRSVGYEIRKFDDELNKLERKLLRIKLRKKGKKLLPCEISSKGSLGCLGIYQCKNCQINYQKEKV